MQEKPIKKLLTFFILYIAQTIPMSFFSTVVPVIMREQKFSLISISMLQLIKLPWVIKFLWSPFVDRYTTSVKDYKRWIFTSEIIYAVLILSIAFFDYQSDFITIIGLLICAFVASATQDIATDALAVLSFSKKDKSLVNSMQSMGSFAGTMIGGGLLLMVFKSFGWDSLLPLLAIFVVIALIPLYFYRGDDVKITTTPQQRAGFSDMFTFFKGERAKRQVGFLFLYYAGIIGILAMVKPWLVDLGYDMKEIGVMSGVFGTLVGFLCSFGSGFVIRRVSRYASRVIFAGFILLVTLYFVFISFVEPTTIMLYCGVFLLWGAYGGATVVVYTSAMDIVRPGREGTDFTVQTVVTHISGIVMAIAAGHLGHWLDYSGIFIFEALIAFISLIYVIFVMKEK